MKEENDYICKLYTEWIKSLINVITWNIRGINQKLRAKHRGLMNLKIKMFCIVHVWM